VTTVLYRAGRYPCRWLFRYLADPLVVGGTQNIPGEGPFLLFPNHQSALDPFLVQSFCPRDVYSMTKSTQFAHPVFRWIIPRILGFPVRRYRVDPQAVRTTLRLLRAGQGVCVYPEGERTWDGSLQPFRRGAVRLALAAGVPVIPCGIMGTYEVWPRWASRPRQGIPVSVRYGSPIRFGPYPDRSARDADLPRAEARLRSALQELCGERAGGRPGPTERSGREVG
jgi:1-acyl-sn-glycerol-3-phosphate acyltransferase